MERKMYEPTEKQVAKWALTEGKEYAVPTDEEFKAMWKKRHGGVERGWGMGKRDYMLAKLRSGREYEMGLWQGRVDKARGLDFSEERNENSYNLGYHVGYVEYESNRKGWDQGTRDRFDAKYVNC